MHSWHRNLILNCHALWKVQEAQEHTYFPSNQSLQQLFGSLIICPLAPRGKTISVVVFGWGTTLFYYGYYSEGRGGKNKYAYKHIVKGGWMRELPQSPYLSTKQWLHYHIFLINTIPCPVVCYLDRIQVGAHDDLVEGPCQFGWQLGLFLQTLSLGVVIQSGTGEEVVDHCDTVVLTWGEKRGGRSKFKPKELFPTPTLDQL